MSFMSSIPLLGGLLSKIFHKVTADKDKILEGQHRINEAELSGAPMSHLRLWRSLLGWVLTIVFAWEVIARSLIQTYWPDALLPPSVLSEVSHILLGMLGLGI